MFLPWLEPDHISRADWLDRATRALGRAVACRDEEDLAKGMRMPCRPSSRLEGDSVPDRAGWRLCLKQRIDPDRAREPLGWSSGRRLGTASFDFHCGSPLSIVAGRRMCRE